MTAVYTDADYLSAYKQKQKYFYIFMGVTAAYLTFCVAWWIYFMGQPYQDPMPVLPQVFIYIASAVYVAFTFLFMGIKYSRVRRYNKMLYYVSEGLKMSETNYFYTFREKSLQKDNLDTVGCVFESWSRKRQEWMEREAYFDVEKPLPEFGEGDLVRYVTQSNFIIEYEILEKHALEFEEVDEDEEETEE
ncbi:MAG: hypothetical protein J6A63_03745 [Clostridia bacterium]|nr:hypothetical protein [Clostridia bacterium]